MKEIRVLAVRQPWASLIVEGLKTIEVRSRPTNIRERVAIYASTAKQETLEGEHGKNYNYRILPTGKIIGTVEIATCTNSKIISQKHFEMFHKYHFAPSGFLVDGGVYFWYLEKPVEFSIPIHYKPPKGAVVWSKTKLPEGVL